MRLISSAKMFLAAGLAALVGAGASAQEDGAVAESLPVIGTPTDGGMGFQPAATEIARDLQWLDGMILVIITFITLFVTGLLAYVILRFNSKRNPTPAGFTHNSPLEVAWTVVPIVVLVFIGSFSLPILFKQQEIPEADINIKVTGYQWYWGYDYVDEAKENGDPLYFESFMYGSSYLGGDNRKTDEVIAELEQAGYSESDWLLATDTAVVVPVGAVVAMQVTGDPTGVIHSWTIPAFGVKQDAVPGRLGQLWFAAEQEGVYFGQCSELCGPAHAYMPITVKVVSEEDYQTWLERVKTDPDYVAW